MNWIARVTSRNSSRNCARSPASFLPPKTPPILLRLQRLLEVPLKRLAERLQQSLGVSQQLRGHRPLLRLRLTLRHCRNCRNEHRSRPECEERATDGSG